jgi:hypothetical protein
VVAVKVGAAATLDMTVVDTTELLVLVIVEADEERLAGGSKEPVPEPEPEPESKPVE